VEITCVQCAQSWCTKCDEKAHWNPKLKEHDRSPCSPSATKSDVRNNLNAVTGSNKTKVSNKGSSNNENFVTNSNDTEIVN